MMRMVSLNSSAAATQSYSGSSSSSNVPKTAIRASPMNLSIMPLWANMMFVSLSKKSLRVLTTSCGASYLDQYTQANPNATYYLIPRMS